MKTFESLFAELSEKAATKQAGSLTVDELAKGTHEEMSQLIYHLQVMMIDRGITLEDIYKNL